MKNKKLLNKFLAAFLSLAMVISIFPASVLAADGETTVGSSGVVTNKTATLTDDGTYTINLEAYATGATTTTTTTVKSGEPLDIVLVLDQSGSMEGDRLSNLKTAAQKFIDSIADNATEYNVDHRIAVVGFAGANRDNGSSDQYYYANSELFIGGTQYNYKVKGKESTYNTSGNLASDHYANAFQTVTNTTDANNLTASINALAAKGGTHPDIGFDMANGIFEANDNTYTKADGATGTRKRIVVMFTDGTPGETGWDASVASDTIAKSYETKNTYGATVYTVGLLSNPGDDVTNFMNYVSSNYPNAQSMTVTTKDEYTPVYAGDLDQNKRYYVLRNESYISVQYSSWRKQWRDNDKNAYTPKTSENDSDQSHTQFYKRESVTTGGPGDKAFDKYYMTTSNSAELDKIFTNISQDVSKDTSSTTVTLDADAVLKDIMANGLKMTDSSKITVTTVSGTTTDGKTIVEGAATVTSESLTVTKVDETTATVKGFDYSNKYIAKGHDGEILKVKITGVIPSDESVTNSVIDTNDDASGIYDKEGTLAATFPKPQTILTSKAYVLDYAKPFTMSASDWKQTSTALYGSFAKADASPKYGKLKNMTYTPNTTKWDGYDNFYAFGKTNDENIKNASANANGNLWSKVSVIPANNVYYEDDFITNESTGTVGIEYTGEWTTDGTSAGNTEIANGDVQGWEESLADDATYSDGSAHVSSTGNSTASFSFTGTGVDIYSRTNQTTGTIYVTVKNTKDGTTTTKRTVVDNKANSGDYYQIPTYTFSGDYGIYDVTVRVTTGAASEGRYTYYLDGIRVYNPIQNQENDTTVEEAYGSDELNAVFTEVRSLLDENSGAAFIDEDANGNTVEKPYTDAEVSELAPEHEVYLAKNQYIVFAVTDNDANAYYLGLKAPSGKTSVAFSNAENAATTQINHASDLYYKVTPSDGKIVVKNTGDNLLSITKLRTAGSGESGISTLSNEDAVNAVMTFNAAKSVSYKAEPETEKEITEEAPVVTEPETTVTEDSEEVTIENPDDSENQATEDTSSSNSWLKNLFSGISSLFGSR